MRGGASFPGVGTGTPASRVADYTPSRTAPNEPREQEVVHAPEDVNRVSTTDRRVVTKTTVTVCIITNC